MKSVSLIYSELTSSFDREREKERTRENRKLIERRCCTCANIDIRHTLRPRYPSTRRGAYIHARVHTLCRAAPSDDDGRATPSPLKEPIIPRTTTKAYYFPRAHRAQCARYQLQDIPREAPSDGLRRIRLTKIPSAKLSRYVHLRTAQ